MTKQQLLVRLRDMLWSLGVKGLPKGYKRLPANVQCDRETITEAARRIKECKCDQEAQSPQAAK